MTNKRGGGGGGEISEGWASSKLKQSKVKQSAGFIIKNPYQNEKQNKLSNKTNPKPYSQHESS